MGPKNQAGPEVLVKNKGKNNKKNKKVRQVLSNPLMGNDFVSTEKQNEDLKKVIQEKLRNLYPKTNVSTGAVLSDLSNEDKKKVFVLPKKDRVARIKTLKAERRTQLKSEGDFLPKLFQSGIIFGIKKTLRALEKNQIKALVYDSNANFDALKVLFDRGQIPMVPLPDLSAIVREIVEFPALCISFPKDNLEPEVVKHFQALLEIVEGHPGAKVINNDGKKEHKLPDVIPAKNTTITSVKIKRKNLKLKSPFVTLLKRESTKERIFHPPNNFQLVKNNADDFKDDFISFKKRPLKSSEDTKISYKKTKMEPMK